MLGGEGVPWGWWGGDLWGGGGTICSVGGEGGYGGGGGWLASSVVRLFLGPYCPGRPLPDTGTFNRFMIYAEDSAFTELLPEPKLLELFCRHEPGAVVRELASLVISALSALGLRPGLPQRARFP